ncbi:MAG: ATP-dependent helicase RhlE, partial [Thermoleophilaceae bacterium]|jgi:superfamily II DNA/RNA helicase|nr:ATP-dependent helicase RhlE [Thermoleophilaceae bacterium]MEA2400196.1 ATP-dependent helicase RhlE [Thermoleophilaceae bacterium]
MSKQSFADLGVSDAVVRALEAHDVTAPFDVQRSVIPDVLAGHDVLVQSPTGSGKTLAFGVPLVDRVQAEDARAAALVLVPTRELASQVTEDLREIASARALSLAAVYGGAGIERQAKLARRAHILVATPGRLEDLVQRGAIRLDSIRLLVLDEADRMLDMGFRPAVDRIVALTPKSRQTLFFSATLEGATGKVAAAFTTNARRHEQRPSEDARDLVEHRFVAVLHEGKLDSLVGELTNAERGRTLVFVRTKRGADRLVKRLDRHGVSAVAIHGNRSQAQREKALARFHSGDIDTLVATDVAARGLDVDDVTHVINFDAPDDRDTYVHRVGRTGRAGRRGIGITLVTGEQSKVMGQIASDLRLHAQFAQSGISEAGGRTHSRPSGPKPQHRQQRQHRQRQRSRSSR